MKKTVLVGACLAMLFAGCSDDDMVKKTTVFPVSGDEVMFGTRTAQFSEGKSRTVYGLPEGADINNFTKLTISWIAGDEVRVYSPEAEEGYKTADYDVLQDADSKEFYLQKQGMNGVHWGDEKTLSATGQSFYAFYPLATGRDGSQASTPIEGLVTDTKVTATIPVAQERGELLTSGNTPAITDPNWKIIAPNMTYAMMAGTGKWTSDNETDNVTLNFKPLVTVLDVIVNGPESNSYSVAQVLVQSKNQPIVGSFTYDVATGEFSDMPAQGTSQNRTASVDCMVPDESGVPTAIKLASGEKLNVKFFLLPRDIKASELSVSVVLSNGQTLTKDLADENAEHNLAQGEIVRVFTPKLNPANVNNWMSRIGDDVLFASQLSIPGTKHSFTYRTFGSESGDYDAEHDIMQSFQSIDIDNQFDAGIRAFDVKVSTGSGQGIQIYSGTENIEPLSNFLNALKSKLMTASTECAVVAINFVDWGDSQSEWLRKLCAEINNWNSRQGQNSYGEQWLQLINSQTTMGDMRQRIGIIVHSPEANPRAYDNISIIGGYSTSVQNTSLVNYRFVRGDNVWIQNLLQVNNPEINVGTHNGAGLTPYFITEAVGKGEATSYDLIDTKLDLIDQLLNTIRQQGTSNLYVNDLGGFCVVNYREWQDGILGGGSWVSKPEESTGSATYHTYNARNIWGWQWNEDGNGTTTIDYANIPEKTGYTYYTEKRPTDNQAPASPEASRGATWLYVDATNSQRGQGGNNALLAEKINPQALTKIYNMVDEGRAPLGVVYMNFAGTDEVTMGGHPYNVYGTQLPAIIISNNFKFALETKSGN